MTIKTLTIFSVLFTFLLSLSSAPSYAQLNTADSLKLQWEVYVLENNMRILLQPDPNADNVSVEFWIQDGNRFDKPEEFGLAHFFEHVMPWSPMDSVRLSKLRSYRTGSNAQVRKDFSRYTQEVKPEGLELLFEQASGRLKVGQEGISKARVEHERKRVLAEIARNSKNVRWSAEGGMAIQAGTFGVSHPYGHNGYGLLENNERFSLEDFQKRYEEVVYASNLTLFVVGNFNTDEAKGHIEYYFSDIPDKEKSTFKANSTSHSTTSITMRAPSPEDKNNTLVRTWAVPKWASIESASLIMLASILNRRLESESTSEKELNMEANSTRLLDFYEFAGRFGIYATFPSLEDSNEVRKQLEISIATLIHDTITEEELDWAKQNEIDSIKEMQNRLGFQNSRTELLGEGLLFANNPDYFLIRLNEQLSVTKDILQKTAQKWLNKQPFEVLFISQAANK